MVFNETSFVAAIVALREQHDVDVAYSSSLEKLFNGKDIPTYNNSPLVNYLFLALQSQFPPVDGECEIERYCYELDYGRNAGKEVISPSELYHTLTAKK